MIKYALLCESSHEFESWFRDSEAFEIQAKRGLVSCPVCQSTKIKKAIMAPRIKRAQPAPEPVPTCTSESQPVALLDEREQLLRAAIRSLREKIEANTDDVGQRFPEEARKMHQGDVPRRSIRGQASLEDARALIEEGIEVMPIPTLPEERN